jgi:hypothetical protein
LTVPINANCGGNQSESQVVYKGRFLLKKGKYRLTLQGTDTVCSSMGCTFERILELQQKSIG